MVDPVFAMYDLQSGIRSKTHSLNLTTMTSDDVLQIPCKKQKVSSQSPSARPGLLAETSDANPQSSMEVYFLSKDFDLILYPSPKIVIKSLLI